MQFEFEDRIGPQEINKESEEAEREQKTHDGSILEKAWPVPFFPGRGV
jgi:hypothetical protein